MSTLTRLHLDDGSRIMMEDSDGVGVNEHKSNGRDLSISIHDYYEMERISQEVKVFFDNFSSTAEEAEEEGCYRVALQFPDELLSDSMKVSWALEEIFGNMNIHNIMFFVLGDTTYGSCCPDEVGAAHLKAHLLVHYGPDACLIPSESLPVLYSFGGAPSPTTTNDESTETKRSNSSLAAEQVWNAFVREETSNNQNKNLLLLYELSNHSNVVPQFHQELLHFKNQYSETHPNDLTEGMNIVVGSVPNHNQHFIKKTKESIDSRSSKQTINEKSTKNCSECDCGTRREGIHHDDTAGMTENSKNTRILGRLEIPSDLDLSNTILLYIGDDETDVSSRHFLNILLRCTSSQTDQLHAIWSWNPKNSVALADSSSATGPQLFNKDPMVNKNIQKTLNRRFFVIQKARMASIYGILVGTLSQSRFRSVIDNIQSQIENEGKASYTMVVGKLNIAKLANFAEIECFVLVACPETSIFKEERDFPIPIITPAELDIALDRQTWGSVPWSTNFQDYLSYHDNQKQSKIDTDDGDDTENNNSDDDDQPFFSLVTGTYVSKPKSKLKRNSSPSQKQPGDGQIMEYKSEAAEFWKLREYQGLKANIGRNEVKAAVAGQVGIASNYEEDRS